jgi:hypothetical protein
MTEFSMIDNLRRLVDRLRSAPSNLVETEFMVFWSALRSQETNRLLLDSLLQRESNNLQGWSGLFINGFQFEHKADLDFIKDANQRVAFAYQVLQGLAQKQRGVADVIINVGLYYAAYQYGPKQLRASDGINSWANIFIDPVIDYLYEAHGIGDIILAIMMKYRQRAEWFDRDRLLCVAKGDTGESGEAFKGQVESRLKQDFYRYLFDKGIEFVIEPKSPKGGGEPDVMTARFSDGRLLIVEAKVYDGATRDKAWLRKGIAQASSYAEDWGEPCAYLLAYNVVENSTLDFSNATNKDYFWSMSSYSREVRILVVNLNNTKPSGQASQLLQHAI